MNIGCECVAVRVAVYLAARGCAWLRLACVRVACACCWVARGGFVCVCGCGWLRARPDGYIWLCGCGMPASLRSRAHMRALACAWLCVAVVGLHLGDCTKTTCDGGVGEPQGGKQRDSRAKRRPLQKVNVARLLWNLTAHIGKLAVILRHAKIWRAGEGKT